MCDLVSHGVDSKWQYYLLCALMEAWKTAQVTSRGIGSGCMTTLSIYPSPPHHQVVAGVHEEERRVPGKRKEHKQVDRGLVGADPQHMSILPPDL